ncbi:MAG: hypothetical protein F4087_09535 [Gemmatimonadetes bacterium]|nr:hypothetical protein [Gemmatimonadota bacterium]MYE69095.1 hypothetical protein [Gemmatimonadota bacterium]MYJ68733.1 hypothetical protein [Gemmatimonadota bacterium]
MKRSVLIAVLLGAACTGAGTSDGAGDEFAPNRIVEPVSPEKRLSLVEELRIGRLADGNEAYLLDLIKGIEIGPGGDIYVLDADEVKVFSPAGEFLRSWGRRGEGPGDFDGTLGLALARDTIAVTDGERVQFFDLGGRLLSSVWTGGPTSGYSAFRIGSTDLGWVVEAYRRTVRLEPGPAPPTPPKEVRYLDPGTGGLGEPIATYLTQPDGVHLASGQRVSRAFYRMIRHGVDRKGDVYLPLGLDHEVSVYGADGVLSRVVRMEVEPVPVTDAMLEELRRELVARCQRNAMWRRRCERQRYVEEIVPATIAHAHERVPVIGHILVAPDGHLLISRRDLGETRASGDPRPYDLVSPEGRFVGRIEIPVNFRPWSVRGRNILGSWTDEFGVMYVVKYRVEGLEDSYILPLQGSALRRSSGE